MHGLPGGARPRSPCIGPRRPCREAACRPETACHELDRDHAAAGRAGAAEHAAARARCTSRWPTWTARSPGTSARWACASTPTRSPPLSSATATRPSSCCTRTRRRAPPAATPGCTTTRCCIPTREELARAAVRLAATRTPIQGASDHRTHEAIYLPDADGNGIELAWDRDREQWPAGLGYDRGPAPLDFDSLLDTVAGEPPTDFVGEGPAHGPPAPARRRRRAGAGLLPRRAGLRASRPTSARPRSSPPAATTTTSASTSGTAGASTGPPPHTAGLRRWTVQLPTDADVAVLRERVGPAAGRSSRSTAASRSATPGARRSPSSRTRATG